MSNTRLRLFQSEDLDSLYAISLATGDAGQDASALYEDGRLMGHIYSAPYALLSPETAFVAQDDVGVAGFVVGVLDTAVFERLMEQKWWPALRAIYADPFAIPPALRSPDQRRHHRIHHPRRTPDHVVRTFPAHLHLNLTPRAQGRGLGRRLMEVWLSNARALGATGVHVGVGQANDRAMAFWTSCGFDRLADLPAVSEDGTVWFGRLSS